MVRFFLMSFCLSLLALAACGGGPGAAPEPGTSNDTYHGNDLPSGTGNDIYHGR